MTKPLLLMDVDGVLCPFGHGHYNFDGHRRNLKTPRWGPDGDGFIFNNQVGVFYDPDNGERLKELMHPFDLRWCTGWGEQANIDIGPLHGLPRLPVVEIAFYTGRRRLYWEHWKLGSIIDTVGDKPFAFVDDDIGPEALAWALRRTQEIAPTLFIRTDPIVGFTEDTYQQLLLFAKVLEDEGPWGDPDITQSDSPTWGELTMSPRRASPSGTTPRTRFGSQPNSEPSRNTQNRNGRMRGKRFR